MLITMSVPPPLPPQTASSAVPQLWGKAWGGFPDFFTVLWGPLKYACFKSIELWGKALLTSF